MDVCVCTYVCMSLLVALHCPQGAKDLGPRLRIPTVRAAIARCVSGGSISGNFYNYYCYYYYFYYDYANDNDNNLSTCNVPAIQRPRGS